MAYSSSNVSPSQKAKRLYAQIATGLVAIALLAGASYILQVGLVGYQRGAAAEINVSGRQRMLSQRTALFALRSAQTTNIEELKKTRKVHASLVELFARSHQNLLEGNKELQLPGHPPPIVADVYFGKDELDKRVREYIKDHQFLGQIYDKRIKNGQLDQPELGTKLSSILENSGPLLKTLHKAVGKYQTVANNTVDRLQLTLALLLVAMLILIALEAGFLFRPMVESIRRHLQKITLDQKALQERDASMQLVLNSMGDGLLTCDYDGQPMGIKSSVVDRWFQIVEGERVWKLLFPTDENKQLELQMTLEEIQEDIMPFEVVRAQMPSRASTPDGRTLSLDVRKIEDSTNGGVLFIIKDITEQLKAEAAQREQAELQVIIGHILNDGNGFRDFLRDTETIMRSMFGLTENPPAFDRALHTVKGNSAIFGFDTLAHECHFLETQLAEVSITRRTAIETLIAAWHRELLRFGKFIDRRDPDEMVISRAEYTKLRAMLEDPSLPPQMVRMIAQWAYLPTLVQLERLERQSQRLADKIGKTVSIQKVHNQLRIPEDYLRDLWPALIHVIRNSIDHGIESANDRIQADKPPAGRLHIETKVDNQGFHLSIEDDGIGIDFNKLREKALAAGRISSDVSDAELIFLDGLSSREEISQFSGRGVGMSEVRHKVESHGGRITVYTRRGVGTRFKFSFPLPPPTLAPLVSVKKSSAEEAFSAAG